jgi:hypothetical protein
MAQIIQPIRNLVNGTRINGVEHIYQTTKPTTRVDGSALVARDKWYKTDDGTEWFWNGTYWLSPERNWHGYLTGTLSQFASAQMALTDPLWQMRYQFIITRVFWSSNITTCDNNNFFSVFFGPTIRNSFEGINTGNNLGFNTLLFTVKQSGFVPPQSSVLNVIPVQNNNTFITGSTLYYTFTGTPSTPAIYVSLFFALIHP